MLTRGAAQVLLLVLVALLQLEANKAGKQRILECFLERTRIFWSPIRIVKKTRLSVFSVIERKIPGSAAVYDRFPNQILSANMQACHGAFDKWILLREGDVNSLYMSDRRQGTKTFDDFNFSDTRFSKAATDGKIVSPAFLKMPQTTNASRGGIVTTQQGADGHAFQFAMKSRIEVGHGCMLYHRGPS